MVAFKGRKTYAKTRLSELYCVATRVYSGYNYNRRLQADKVASQSTKPGFFPRSKLPNKLSSCKALAPLIVAHPKSCSVGCQVNARAELSSRQVCLIDGLMQGYRFPTPPAMGQITPDPAIHP
jgi:hypothetical protein